MIDCFSYISSLICNWNCKCPHQATRTCQDRPRLFSQLRSQHNRTSCDLILYSGIWIYMECSLMDNCRLLLVFSYNPGIYLLKLFFPYHHLYLLIIFTSYLCIQALRMLRYVLESSLLQLTPLCFGHFIRYTLWPLPELSQSIFPSTLEDHS